MPHRATPTAAHAGEHESPAVELFSHLLVPTDGSAPSRLAAGRAVAIAAAMGARLTFLHVKPEPRQSFLSGEGGGFVDQMPLEEFDRVSEQQARRYLAQLQALADRAGVACQCVVAQPVAPYAGIVAAAQTNGCDLIVMASHGRRGIKSLILGSETNKVLTHSKVPVLVYR